MLLLGCDIFVTFLFGTRLTCQLQSAPQCQGKNSPKSSVMAPVSIPPKRQLRQSCQIRERQLTSQYSIQAL
jgi:hypothetical protein